LTILKLSHSESPLACHVGSTLVCLPPALGLDTFGLVFWIVLSTVIAEVLASGAAERSTWVDLHQRFRMHDGCRQRLCLGHRVFARIWAGPEGAPQTRLRLHRAACKRGR